jgi:hypothetical protein
MAAQGTATLDFGAFPGGSDTSVAVTGQTGILAGSLAEAWLFPALTTDHTADEHIAESIRVAAGNVVAGIGFTIYGWNTSEINEPVDYPPNVTQIVTSTGGTAIAVKTVQTGARAYGGGIGTRIYGKWNVAWVWN